MIAPERNCHERRSMVYLRLLIETNDKVKIMCGRFALERIDLAFGEAFGISVPESAPRYNIAPSQRVIALMNIPESGGISFHSLHSYGTQKNHVALAVSWLRANYKEPFRVEDLAERVHMSASTLHRHFKEITSLSPIQFKKRLRLHEAQRLMLGEDYGITEVCDAVGYDNIAQFTREYKRLFGEPPRRDVMRWKQMGASLAIAE